MEDQGKRLLLAVVAAFAIMMLWNQFFPAGETASCSGKTASVGHTGGRAIV